MLCVDSYTWEKSTLTTKRSSHHQKLVHRFIFCDNLVTLTTTTTIRRKLVGARNGKINVLKQCDNWCESAEMKISDNQSNQSPNTP